MPTYVGLAICFAVLAALLPSSTAEHHKKKIIVKVPHVIKHIHHDHYKPIHIHTVRHHKKLEHHYRKNEGKHKSHGSYSHVQPVLAHHDEGEHRQAMEYNQRQHHGLEYEQGRGYGQNGVWRPEDNHDDWKFRGSAEDSEENQWRPFSEEYGGEDWGSSEEMDHYKEGRDYKGGRGKGRNNGIPIIIRPNHNDYENDNGWKPMMDFSNWKDESDQRDYGRYPSDMYNYSGEQYSGGGSEENYSQEETVQKKKKKQKRNKKKWNKQIEVREPVSEEKEPQDSYQVNQIQQQNQPIMPLINVPLPQPSLWPQVSSVNHEQSSWPASSQSQKLQWTATQPTTSATWQSNSQSQPVPTQVVWSGHHLQLPSQTMWQVQQHSVKSPVSLPSSAVKPVLPPLPNLGVHQRSLPDWPLTPKIPQPVQQPQSSLRVQQTAVPQWPMTQKTPQGQPVVKQQWQQSVSTSGRDGPAASYKVEVINYANSKTT